MKIFYGPTTPTFFRQGNHHQISAIFTVLQSRDEIFLKGGGM
jgi:hypothetical protein